MVIIQICNRSGPIVASFVLPDQEYTKDNAQDESNPEADDHGQEARRIARRFVFEEELWPNYITRTVGDEHLVSFISHMCLESARWTGSSHIGAYHRVHGVLLREATDIAARHAQDQWEVRGVCDAEAVSEESWPNTGGIQLADHDRAYQGDGKVERHEVSTCVLQVRTAESADNNEDGLESDTDHLDKKRVQGREAEAFDDDAAKLRYVS